MDEATLSLIIGYAVTALGGIVGANIIGGLLRGGGGVVGRTLIGAIGGVGLGYAATQVAAIAEYSNMLSFNLEPPLYGQYLRHFLTGGAGGVVLGLIAAILFRPRG